MVYNIFNKISLKFINLTDYNIDYQMKEKEKNHKKKNSKHKNKFNLKYLENCLKYHPKIEHSKKSSILKAKSV